MSKRTTDIVSYLTVIGLIVAFVVGDRRASRFHLNQALVLWVVSIVWAILYAVLRLIAFFPIGLILSVINFVISLFLLVDWILGLVRSVQGEERPLPIIGGIVLYH